MKTLQRIRNAKSRVTMVTRGATGNNPKTSRKHLSKTYGKHKIKELQTTAILGITHTFREVLIQKGKRFNMGNIITRTVH